MPSNFNTLSTYSCSMWNQHQCMYDLFMETNKMEYLEKKDMQYVFTAVCARPIIAKGLSAFPLSNPIFMGYSLVVNACCRL